MKRNILKTHQTWIASSRHRAWEILLDIAHLEDMHLIALGTAFVPSTVFRFMRPAWALRTDRTFCLDPFNYLLLLILCCCLEEGTIFDPFSDSLSSRFSFVFVGFFITGETGFASSLDGSCSLGLTALPWVQLIARWTLLLLAISGESSIDRFIGKNLLGCPGRVFQEDIKFILASLLGLNPPPYYVSR